MKCKMILYMYAIGVIGSKIRIHNLCFGADTFEVEGIKYICFGAC